MRRFLLLALLILPLSVAGRCSITLLVAGLDADVDDDAWVTAQDVNTVFLCAGHDPDTEPACAGTDVDRDGDVDSADATHAQRLLGSMVCNRATELCSRPLDQVAFPTTHNSMGSTEEGWFLPNNDVAIPTQLADGIRGLMLDTHYFDDGEYAGVYTCHGVGFCNLGFTRFRDELTRIKAFLDTHLGEVVVLIFESYVTAADTAAVFEEVGLLDPLDPGSDALYTHPGGAWPTLGALVASNQRLVVLTDDAPTAAEAAAYPWYHYLWDSLAFETPFDLNPADFPVPGFTCEDLRGEPGNDLFILNHFLTNSVGHQTYAEMVNHDPFFTTRALECQTFQGRIPNFVAVDFHTIGDLFDVVRVLNGLQAAP